MNKVSLKNIVWKEGKHYVAWCLNTDISSFGETKEEALESLQEALELYFEGDVAPKFTKIERPDIVPMSLQYA